MYNNFIAEGDKIASEIINSQTFEIENIYALPEWFEKHSNLNSIIKDKVIEINKKSMDQISQLSTSTSIYILLKKPYQAFNQSLIKNRYTILLDAVQDPGNVGTIIRIADWFGIPNVVSNLKTADFFHPRVVQASMGSICHVNLMRLNDEETNQLVKENHTYALTLDGEVLTPSSLAKTGIIIMGNEGQGVSNELLSMINHKIYIPGAGYKGAESLNVSVATGIIGYNILSNTKKKV